MKDSEIKLCKEVITAFNKASFNVSAVELMTISKVFQLFASFITEHENLNKITIKEDKKSRIKK